MNWGRRVKSPGSAYLRKIDEFVDVVHWDPGAAARMLDADKRLAIGVSSWGESPIQAASHVGRQELILSLLERGAPLDLFGACVVGDLKAVVAALAGKPRNACGVHGLPAIHFGIVSRDVEVVTLLIEEGVALAPRRASISPLHSAVAVGVRPIVDLLLERGADPSARDAFGATPLDWANRLYGAGSPLVRTLTAVPARTTCIVLPKAC
jgi:hypothetical protein